MGLQFFLDQCGSKDQIVISKWCVDTVGKCCAVCPQTLAAVGTRVGVETTVFAAVGVILYDMAEAPYTYLTMTLTAAAYFITIFVATLGFDYRLSEFHAYYILLVSMTFQAPFASVSVTASAYLHGISHPTIKNEVPRLIPPWRPGGNLDDLDVKQPWTKYKKDSITSWFGRKLTKNPPRPPSTVPHAAAIRHSTVASKQRPRDLVKGGLITHQSRSRDIPRSSSSRRRSHKRDDDEKSVVPSLESSATSLGKTRHMKDGVTYFTVPKRDKASFFGPTDRRVHGPHDRFSTKPESPVDATVVPHHYHDLHRPPQTPNEEEHNRHEHHSLAGSPHTSLSEVPFLSSTTVSPRPSSAEKSSITAVPSHQRTSHSSESAQERARRPKAKQNDPWRLFPERQEGIRQRATTRKSKERDVEAGRSPPPSRRDQHEDLPLLPEPVHDFDYESWSESERLEVRREVAAYRDRLNTSELKKAHARWYNERWRRRGMVSSSLLLAVCWLVMLLFLVGALPKKFPYAQANCTPPKGLDILKRATYLSVGMGFLIWGVLITNIYFEGKLPQILQKPFEYSRSPHHWTRSISPGLFGLSVFALQASLLWASYWQAQSENSSLLAASELSATFTTVLSLSQAIVPFTSMAKAWQKKKVRREKDQKKQAEMGEVWMRRHEEKKRIKKARKESMKEVLDRRLEVSERWHRVHEAGYKRRSVANRGGGRGEGTSRGPAHNPGYASHEHHRSQ